MLYISKYEGGEIREEGTITEEEITPTAAIV
jgi:hypothetical protein